MRLNHSIMHKKSGLYSAIILLLASGLAIADKSISALPTVVSNHWSTTTQLGEAKFSRFGIHIYDASLWSLSKDSDTTDSKHATALSIEYARNIKADKLLSSTLKQWRRLGFADQYPLEAWLKQLEKIWPNVKPGDRIIFVSKRDGSNSFYSNDQELGSINDVEFNSAFLDIWLSPKAKYQKHRKELLGETL